MADRRSLPRYVTPQNDALWRERGFNDDLEMLLRVQLTNGLWVTGEFGAAALLLRVKHNLSREYVGATAFLLLTVTGTAPSMICLAPENARAQGFDPDHYVSLQRASTTGGAMRVRFWVF